MPAVIAAGSGKTVGEDAAFQIFAERLPHKGFGCVVVALPVELACAGEFIPGLEVFGNGLIEKGALRMARVVELGLAC